MFPSGRLRIPGRTACNASHLWTDRMETQPVCKHHPLPLPP